MLYSFATSCDLSDDGARISCECRPGYYGARCQSCAAGFYGRPEVPGKKQTVLATYLYCCTVHFEDSLSITHQRMH